MGERHAMVMMMYPIVPRREESGRRDMEPSSHASSKLAVQMRLIALAASLMPASVMRLSGSVVNMAAIKSVTSCHKKFMHVLS
eukprot:5919850-Amphidinium_carterae.1